MEIDPDLNRSDQIDDLSGKLWYSRIGKRKAEQSTKTAAMSRKSVRFLSKIGKVGESIR